MSSVTKIGALDWRQSASSSRKSTFSTTTPSMPPSGVDAARQVQAGFVADGAEREVLGRAMRDRATEIRPELVVHASKLAGSRQLLAAMAQPVRSST